MNDFAIEINGLRKTFQDRAAVNGLNLKVPAGSIFGFLGRNGAGKTTTIKLLMGMLKADAGTASIFGLPVSDPRASIEARRRIGFVTEDKDLYPYMTVDQILRFTQPFFSTWRSDLEPLFENVRPSAETQGCGLIEGDALKAHVVARDLARS